MCVQHVCVYIYVCIYMHKYIIYPKERSTGDTTSKILVYICTCLYIFMFVYIYVCIYIHKYIIYSLSNNDHRRTQLVRGGYG